MTASEHTARRHHLEVSGMSCDNCVSHVEEALLGVEGVSQAKVDLESGHADVEGESIDANQLVEAVSRAGYGVRSAN
jgi:copper chaperone CopZ